MAVIGRGGHRTSLFQPRVRQVLLTGRAVSAGATLFLNLFVRCEHGLFFKLCTFQHHWDLVMGILTLDHF